jgi:hypothetical protein
MSLTTNVTIHTNKTNILVTEAIIHTKGKFIIVISGLDKDIVNNICLEMSQKLNYTYLFFLDNPIIDDSKYYNNIFYRVEELLKIKPQGIIISLLSYPDKYTMIDVKLHINLSINQTYFNNIKNKYKYSDNFLIEYNNILKSNKVNKYINIKLDSDFKKIKKQCFDTIITSIEKKYYGTNYDKVLENRNYNKSNNTDDNFNNTKSTDNKYKKCNNNSDSNSSDNSDSNNSRSDNSDSNNSRSDSSDSNNSRSDNSDSSSSEDLNSDSNSSEDLNSDSSSSEDLNSDSNSNKSINLDSNSSEDLNAYSSASITFNQDDYYLE